MEGIGQLTGGVAHDFNNLLTIIIGNLETLQRNLGAGEIDVERLGRAAGHAMRGARRAESLTQRLLAFARQQPLKLEVVEPNVIITNLRKMLSRIIREDIELAIELGARVNPIKVDPGQLEQCLMNLVVNSRDAMRSGGKLSIVTASRTIREGEAMQREIDPGEFAVISVSDTGHGMSKEVLSHIFEPFFTTKEVGKGTGLGLAVVYGIVRQCGGFLDIVSQVNVGTTMRLFFPALDKADLNSPMIPGLAPRRGDATILLVEDEPELRTGLARVLKSSGYMVLEAGNGEQALSLMSLLGKAKIDLVICDVVMPKMNGPDFAKHLERIRPGLKLIFMSGHADEVFADGVGLQVHLHKPFVPQVLLEQVERTLATVDSN